MRPFPRSQTSDNRLRVGTLVEYQQHGTLALGVIVEEKRNKFVVRNRQAATLELGAERLLILEPQAAVDAGDPAATARYLEALECEIEHLFNSLDLRDAWELLREEGGAQSSTRILELLFSSPTIAERSALRRLLFSEQAYFKRQKKSDLFEPRSEELVEDLLRQQRIAKEKAQAREHWISTALDRLAQPSAPLPEPLAPLEQLAAQGKSAPDAKETQQLVDETIERTKLKPAKTASQRAYDLLVALGHFSPHELLTPYRLGRPLQFSSAELKAAQAAEAPPSSSHEKRNDVRAITIDGAETKDFDDALSVEFLGGGRARIGIHISDVTCVVHPESQLDSAALRRATSIYCPDRYYPMLPPILSEKRLSLRAGETRPVVSTYLVVDEKHQIERSELRLETITIAKRATYEEVDESLYEESHALSEYAPILRFLWEFASASETRRIESGAAQFVRREVSPSVDEQFRVSVEHSDEDTPARKLVSELMIVANRIAASFAASENIPLLFRAQAAPEVNHLQQGLDIPEGPARDFFQRSFFKRSVIQTTPEPHFGLGVEQYTQVTSPIRRAVDLVNQQQLTSFLQTGKASWNASEVGARLELLQTGLDEAFQIQRESNRYWLLRYLVQEKIRQLSAIVMRVDGPRPLAEVDVLFSIFSFHPMKGVELKPGDHIKLEIQSIEPRKDSIVLRHIA